MCAGGYTVAVRAVRICLPAPIFVDYQIELGSRLDSILWDMPGAVPRRDHPSNTQENLCRAGELTGS
jgi:hypothetical protein